MAVTLRPLQAVSDVDLLEYSRRNPGYQFERTASGELVVTPTGGEGGRRSGEVFAQLHAWNRDKHLGVVFDSSTGFHLPDGSLRSPDASWVSGTRWEALTPEQRDAFPPLCPDAVFELASPSDQLRDLQAKMRSYLDNRVRVGVLIDPQERAVTIYCQGKEADIHRAVDAVPLDDVLPGFTLLLAPVFSR
jgi:Uma2 family endonuclease